MRRALDRLVAVIARLATRGLFRSVEVVGFDELERGTPRLIVANHFNGFVDPVVIAGALGRLPRFIAKATLWKVPGVGLLLGAAGVLPVHRTVDGGGDNRGTFHEVVRELHGGETVAIFPEGTTHDNPHLSPVRTGAARLALDAAADGVAGIEVVPVGVTFEDKVALRTRVVVRAGAPIDPAATPYRDEQGRPLGSADHDAVRRLTDDIRAGLADVAPDFEDLLAAAEMRR
ncbi:MAG: 1-acyl-sn-glycerol-3-phosphate acyltransferase, partial [Acidimicrobiales bacterium]|nr:1-acyl-sn-glycerol-3-phosphate acyltransferase [Acidimicrobiales bacterium]